MKDKVIQVLKERNIIMIDEYQTMATKGRFQCQHHHEWISSADNIIRKNSNCPVCFYDTKRLTTEVIRNRLKNSDIELVGEYLGSVRKKQKFICRNGHTFVSRVNSILNTKLCVICSSGGGFDVNKSSYAYIIRFNSFIKYGITGNLDQRLAHHRKSGDFIVVAVMFFESGRDALVWETSVKRDHGGNFVSSNHLANGFTETLSLDKEQIIVQTLRLSKQKN
jgi:hypothetical protein